ncbi:hypothetical protein ACWGH4_18490 [Streptomyces sp. NPDC054847]
MRLEVRSGKYLSTELKLDHFKQMVADIEGELGEPVTVTWMADTKNYRITTGNADDLVSESEPEKPRTLRNVTMELQSVATGDVLVCIRFGGSSNWHLSGPTLYRSAWVVRVVMRHRDGVRLSAAWGRMHRVMASESRARGSNREGIPRWLRILQPFMALMFAVAIEYWITNEWPIRREWPDMLAVAAFPFLFNWVACARVRVRPAWWREQLTRVNSSWNPSDRAVRIWTIVAGIFAIPAFAVGLLALFNG